LGGTAHALNNSSSTDLVSTSALYSTPSAPETDVEWPEMLAPAVPLDTHSFSQVFDVLALHGGFIPLMAWCVSLCLCTPLSPILCHITSSLSSSGPLPVSGVSIDGTCHPPPPNLDSQYTSWSHTTHACQAHCFYASSAFVWALLHQSLASVLWAECRGLEGQCTTNIQSFWEGSSLYGHFCIDPWLLSGCRAQGPERAMHY
jgi:hypothetical protein